MPQKGPSGGTAFPGGTSGGTENFAQQLRPPERARGVSSPHPPIFRGTCAKNLFTRVRRLSDKQMGEEVGEHAVILSENRRGCVCQV